MQRICLVDPTRTVYW